MLDKTINRSFLFIKYRASGIQHHFASSNVIFTSSTRRFARLPLWRDIGRGGEVSLVLRDNIIVELLYQPSIMKERCDVRVQKNGYIRISQKAKAT